jgi:hypothetical protein
MARFCRLALSLVAGQWEQARRSVVPALARASPNRRKLIAAAIVGHQPLHTDAHPSKEGQRPPGQAGHGLGLLIGVNLQIGDPGAVVDGHMQKVIAQALPALATEGAPASVDAVATSIRDAALFLDIDIRELPGPLALAATTCPVGRSSSPGRGRRCDARRRVQRNGPRPAPTDPMRRDPPRPPDASEWPARDRSTAAAGCGAADNSGRPGRPGPRHASAPASCRPWPPRPLGLGRPGRRPAQLQHPLHQQSPARHGQLRQDGP